MAEETVQSGLSDNAASGLAYFTLIPAIIFLVVAPYNQKANIRFHCWQSIFLGIACIVVDVILTMIPVVGLDHHPDLRLAGPDSMDSLRCEGLQRTTLQYPNHQ